MLVRWSHPTNQVVDSWRQLNRIFDDSFGFGSNGAFNGVKTFAPLTDVVEDEKQFTLRAELPGISAADVSIQLDGNTLTIGAEKKVEQKENGEKVHRIERSTRSYKRIFTLPETVQSDKIEANMADGILTVALPKTPRPEPRAIRINGSK